MPEYHFYSEKRIGMHSTKTREDAHDEFLQWTFDHLLDLEREHPESIVRCENYPLNKHVVIFTVNGVEIERWEMRPLGIVGRLAKWIERVFNA